MLHRNVGELLNNRVVVALSSDASVREAAGCMKKAHVASVVVTEAEDRHLAGIFTERDLTERVVADGLDPDRTRLAAVMTPHPMTVGPETTVQDALRHMHDNGMRHLPIVQNGRVLGVVSMRDFMGEELADIDRERTLMESLTEIM